MRLKLYLEKKVKFAWFEGNYKQIFRLEWALFLSFNVTSWLYFKIIILKEESVDVKMTWAWVLLFQIKGNWKNSQNFLRTKKDH